MIGFLDSQLGGAITIAAALCAFLGALFWVSRPGHPDRWTTMLASLGTCGLVGAINLTALKAGWWQYLFFQIPLPVSLAIYLPFSIAAFTLWVGLYHWLVGSERHAFVVYLAVVLLFIPIVLLLDPQRMGGGYTLWADVFIGQLVMLSPVVFYELIRRANFHFYLPLFFRQIGQIKPK